MVFNYSIPNKAVKLWSGVLEYENQMKEHPFEEVASYTLACHTTLMSNDVVRRIFSHMTNVKIK